MQCPSATLRTGFDRLSANVWWSAFFALLVAVCSIASPSTAQTLPKVTGFELPVSELSQVAESSGLLWVSSDSAKIAAVQAAIANEPKPVRVPRERPAPIVLTDEPLVLVETRRDLSQLQLPIDRP